MVFKQLSVLFLASACNCAVLHKLAQTTINNAKPVPHNLIAKSKLYKFLFLAFLWDHKEWTIRECFVLLEGRLISVASIKCGGHLKFSLHAYVSCNVLMSTVQCNSRHLKGEKFG